MRPRLDKEVKTGRRRQWLTLEDTSTTVEVRVLQ